MPEEKKDYEEEISEELLVPLEDYLTNGIHVGLAYRSKDMRKFIYKVRPDKLCVFDVKKIDERLRVAGKFISGYQPEEVLAVSNRVYGRKPIEKFSQYTGCKAVAERFVSGTLTNPEIEPYVEPKLLIVTDPFSDHQAIKEASLSGIPVIAICDSNTKVKGIDLVVPSNNKGKNALALIYWILTKEVLKERGVKEKFNAPLEEFISKVEPSPHLVEMRKMQRRMRRKK